MKRMGAIKGLFGRLRLFELASSSDTLPRLADTCCVATVIASVSLSPPILPGERQQSANHH